MSNPDLSEKNIVVAPLNWGLGHATRSMPIIDLLLTWNANVILAGDGRSLDLLRSEYPSLEYVELPAYNVTYGKNGMVASTLIGLPTYLKAVRAEHRMLKRMVDQGSVDMVISDNRYGMYDDRIPCIFICHQLSILPPPKAMFTFKMLHAIHKQFFLRFDEIWIPDHAGVPNLSGKLSHSFERNIGKS